MSTNFIKYSGNINIPLFYSGLNRNVDKQNNNVLEILIDSFQDELITLNNLYIYQDVTLICDQNSVFNFKLTSILENRIVLTCSTNIDNIVFKRLFLQPYSIQGGNLTNNVFINTVESFGQYFKEGVISTKLRINVIKPKIAVINKYIIKYQSDLDSDFEVTNLIDIDNKDFKGNDIISFTAVANEYVFYKVAAYYSLGSYKFTNYSEIFKIERQNITYQNDIQ